MLLYVPLVLGMQSCASIQGVVYVVDAERDSAQKIVTSYANSIHPGDQLYIYVHSQIPESVIPFNQETHTIAAEMGHVNVVGERNGENVMPETYRRKQKVDVQGYLVGDDGMIVFPVLGKLHVEGLTYDSLQTMIQNRLIAGDYLYDPVVTVSPMNFRVSVVGEVARPRELHITGDRLTLLEALAMCGDLTEYGVRENVVVVREKNGEVVPLVVDLTRKTLFDSECYYLQHNDIVYIEPNAKKRKEAIYDPNLYRNIASYVRLGMAIGSMVYTRILRISRFN